MNPTILFENEHILAVNKPSGMLVHTDGRATEKTLSDWFVSRYPQAKDVGEPMETSTGALLPRPGVVHRLDKDTSGVVLLAKDQETFLFLKNAFKNREIRKVYNTFVSGSVKDDRGVITRPIGKSKKDPRRYSAQRGARGAIRDAITQYRVIERGEGTTYLEVRPKTGRTHQIRVHMKALNHPVVCDSLYAPDEPARLGFKRLALHAREISFVDQEGNEHTIEAPLPEDFVRALESL